MAAPMISAQFKAIVEPILNEPFDGLYNQRAEEYKVAFDDMAAPFKRSYYEEPVISGFGMAPELPEGKPFDYDSGQTFYIPRAVYKVYGLAFALTKEVIEDGEHIQMGSVYSRHLAQSLVETKETVYANVINRAFNGSYVWGDGRPLIDSAHPLVTGGTWSNQLATSANLSQTSLEQALIQISNAVDNNGKRIRLTPKKLIVANNNMFQAEVLLKSTLRTGTANNDINPIKSMGNILSEGFGTMSRLTNPNAWYIKTDAPRGMFNVKRRGLDRGMEGDFETRSMRYKADERYAPIVIDPRSIYGSAGT